MTNREYIEKNYPELYPCKECYYWRGFGAGIPFCHYNIIHDKLRGSYPDFANQKCDKFRKKGEDFEW